MGKKLQTAYILLTVLLLVLPACAYGITRSLPFEDAMLTANSLFDYRVLRTSSSPSVIVGKDGWLFYSGSQDNDEDQIADYLGNNLFTEEELSVIASNLTAMRDEIGASGARFVVVINPNKARLYSEKMPAAYGAVAEKTRLTQVLDYLERETDLTVVSTLDALSAYRTAHPETPVCFRYDTHWNNIGAYVATCAVNEVLGNETRDIETLTVKDGPVPDYDLARLLHLTTVLTDDSAPSVEGYTDFYLETTFGEDTREPRIHNYGTEADAGKVLMIGDSYGAFMLSYIACYYHDAFLSHYTNFDRTVLAEEAPDLVIYETVERYLGVLLTYSVDGLPEQ